MKSKIIILNSVFIIFLYFVSEYISYGINFKNERIIQSVNNSFIGNTLTLPINNFRKENAIAEFKEERNHRIAFRKTVYEGTDHNKRSVILYGCSFTNGVFLDDDENFSGQIRNLTKRLVYNRGLAGYGIQHSLFHIENNLKFLLTNNKNNKNAYPKYVIYTFIEDHINRLYRPNDYFDNWLMYYKYNKEQNNLVEISDLDIAFWHSYILRTLYLKKYYDCTNSKIVKKENKQKFLTDIFLQMKKSLQKQIKDVEFTIFVYDGDNQIREIEDILTNNGIKIVYLSELSNENFNSEKYQLINDFHPNALAWEVITPLIIKKLNL